MVEYGIGHGVTMYVNVSAALLFSRISVLSGSDHRPQARHKFVFRALQQLAAVGSGVNASAAATGAFSVSSSTMGAPSSAASFADVLLRLDFNHHYRDEYARQREPMRMPLK
jgi:hypothetical protein